MEVELNGGLGWLTLFGVMGKGVHLIFHQTISLRKAQVKKELSGNEGSPNVSSKAV